MEVGELKTYHSLVAGGLVSPSQGYILKLWSLAKFVRRWLLTAAFVR
jgi:hypothetical protein